MQEIVLEENQSAASYSEKLLAYITGPGCFGYDNLAATLSQAECESTKYCNWANCRIGDPSVVMGPLGLVGQCTEGSTPLPPHSLPKFNARIYIMTHEGEYTVNFDIALSTAGLVMQ